MRFLKPILIALAAVFALVAGLFAAAIAVLGGIGLYLARRVFGRGTARRPAPPPAPHRGGSSGGNGDVIDVTVTEVR
jgi:hypothetical protein